MTNRLFRRPGRPALLFAAAGLAACSNPLAPLASDYGDAVPLDRFRSIDRLELPAAPEDAGPGPSAGDRFAGLESVGLTLEACRASSLEHNLDIRASLIDPAIANESVTEAEAAFEAAANLTANWTQTDSPTSSSLDGAQQEFQSLEPSVTIPLRTGGTASVALPMARNETDNSFATLNPAYTSDLRFSLSQPLLRGAGRFASTYAIRIAAIGTRISEAQAKVQVIATLAETDRAYWRLYLARELLAVRQQQHELAEAQLRRAENRVRAGASAEVELVRAQSGVADSLEAIIVAANGVVDAQRALKRIANMPGLGVETRTMIVPSTPPDPARYTLDRDALVASALSGRMELLQLELQLAQDAAGIRFSENQALPSLALSASYTINGLGESLGDSVETTAENRFEDWSLGVSGSIPLGNEEAAARLRRAVLQRLQRLATRSGREQVIVEEVLGAIDAIEAGWQRIIAARQAVILNTRTLEAEQRQFDQGLSTSTDVLDASARLADSRSSEIRAVVDYQIQQVNLAVATGTLLGAARVRWEPAPAPTLEGPFYAPRASDADAGR